MKRTGWNKGTDKPVYSKPGFEVYERKYDDGKILLCVFRSGEWHFAGGSVEVAVHAANLYMPSAVQYLPWRGLSSPPKGFKP